MQVLITTSRSISQDPFYQRQQQKRFKLHTQKIQNILSNKLQPSDSRLNVQIVDNLRKSQSAARLFRKEQQKVGLKKQNLILVKKLANAQSSIKIPNLQNKPKQKLLSSTLSNWSLKRKQDERIKKQNQIINKRVQTFSNTNIKDFKRKIQQQIKDYVKLKNQIRKIKQNRNQSQCGSKTQRSKPRKISLKLPFLNEQTQKNEKIQTDQIIKQNQILNQGQNQKIVQETINK